MKSRRLIAVAALAVALAAPAWADIDGAKELLRQGNDEAALEELESLAFGGDAEAMVLLGDMHHAGNGVAANFSLAWSWYNRASRQSNPDAQYKLGRMMSRGEGAPKNDVEALELFELAAGNGHEQAQLQAGLIYRDGTRQTRKSESKALQYLTAAAAQGNAEAELALEELQEQGTARNDEVEQASPAQAKPQVTQNLQAMDEPERIRTAIAAWIDSINVRFESTAAGPPTEVIVRDVDGVFEVEIPDLVFTSGGTESVRFGLVELTLTPIAGEPQDPDVDWMATRRYRLDMTPPTRIEMRSGLEVFTLTYESSDITGVWLPTFFNFVETNMEMRNLQVADEVGQVVARAERATWVANIRESEPDIWGGPYAMEVSNLVLTPPAGGSVTLGRIFTETVLDGVKAEPYGRLVNQLNNDPEALVTALLDPATGGDAIDEMIDLVASSSFDLAIEDVVYVDPQGIEAFSLARLGFGGGASHDGGDNATLSMTYEHAGLSAPIEGPEAAVIPHDARMAFDVDRIPLESMARGMIEILGVAMVEMARAESDTAMSDDFSEAELQSRFMSIVSAAKTGIKVDVSMDSALTSLALLGGVEASNEALFGLIGEIELTVSDIDGVLAMADQDPMMAAYKDIFTAFSATAVREPGANGSENAKFVFAIQADGNFLVNGENAMAIASGAMAPPQEGQEN